MAYIGEHYHEPNIGVTAIAQHLGISEGHLSHTFKKKTDYTLLNIPPATASTGPWSCCGTAA